MVLGKGESRAQAAAVPRRGTRRQAGADDARFQRDASGAFFRRSNRTRPGQPTPRGNIAENENQTVANRARRSESRALSAAGPPPRLPNKAGQNPPGVK